MTTETKVAALNTLATFVKNLNRSVDKGPTDPMHIGIEHAVKLIHREALESFDAMGTDVPLQQNTLLRDALMDIFFTTFGYWQVCDYPDYDVAEAFNGIQFNRYRHLDPEIFAALMLTTDTHSLEFTYMVLLEMLEEGRKEGRFDETVKYADGLVKSNFESALAIYDYIGWPLEQDVAALMESMMTRFDRTDEGAAATREKFAKMGIPVEQRVCRLADLDGTKSDFIVTFCSETVTVNGEIFDHGKWMKAAGFIKPKYVEMPLPAETSEA